MPVFGLYNVTHNGISSHAFDEIFSRDLELRRVSFI